MESNKKKALIAQLTLEEKAGLCSGGDFWHLKGIERLGIPAIMVSDGPNGLRKQEDKADHLGINESIKAVCFPPAALFACSFDRTLMEELGDDIMYVMIGGDIRPHVIEALQYLVGKIKRECVTEREIFSAPDRQPL